jgi:hypothetical protein
MGKKLPRGVLEAPIRVAVESRESPRKLSCCQSDRGRDMPLRKVLHYIILTIFLLFQSLRSV